MDGHKPHALEYFPVSINSRDSIIHYTCNSPSKKVLDKYGIKLLGDQFGCKDAREVIEIPREVYTKSGLKDTSNKMILNINLEKLMRELK